MRPNVIAFANHKGGVGKTTSVANVGGALALAGKRTLLIDLDSQENLTYHFLSEEEGEAQEASVYESIVDGARLPILNVRPNLDLVPASIELGRAESDLNGRSLREYILRGILERDAGGYDFILIDCPPSLGVVTSNALTAARDLYIPLTAETLPLRGLTRLEDIVQLIQRRTNRSLRLSGIFITRYNNRSLNDIVERNIRQRYGERVFATRIRENIALAECPFSGKLIYEYAPSSNGAKDYRRLTGEILARFDTYDTNK
ncbi:MAG: ParA family protein [Clostridia bacterium]|nr:ParA family protein [Clostridia bacterium]